MVEQPVVGLTGRAPTSPCDFYKVCGPTDEKPAGYFEVAVLEARADGYYYARALQAKLNMQADSTWNSVVSIGASITGSPVMDTLWGLDVYLPALGTATVAEYCGISIGMNNTNAAGTHCSAIRVYGHGYVAMDTVIRLAGAQATTLFKIAQCMEPAADNGAGTTVLTGNCYKIAVDIAGDIVYLVAVGTVTTTP